MIGNLNLPGISWQNLTADNKGAEVLETCQELGLSQAVNFPTHIKGNILDVALTNKMHRILNVENLGNISNSDQNG